MCISEAKARMLVPGCCPLLVPSVAAQTVKPRPAPLNIAKRQERARLAGILSSANNKIEL